MTIKNLRRIIKHFDDADSIVIFDTKSKSLCEVDGFCWNGGLQLSINTEDKNDNHKTDCK